MRSNKSSQLYLMSLILQNMQPDSMWRLLKRLTQKVRRKKRRAAAIILFELRRCLKKIETYELRNQ